MPRGTMAGFLDQQGVAKASYLYTKSDSYVAERTKTS